MSELSQLFVYGIFLGEHNRYSYGLLNPRYATVKNYVTYGSHIVTAYAVDAKAGVTLTGLLCDVPPDYNWRNIDALEGGYSRVIIQTESGEQAYMYAGKD